ncbi:hypothetical protein FGU64_05475 [Mesorhizobium sp. 8]|nr:hypothetical protein FGU64_05475 [Mesorhizobium sp. 8]
MMPKSAKRFSDDIMVYLINLAACVRRQVIPLGCNMLEAAGPWSTRSMRVLRGDCGQGAEKWARCRATTEAETARARPRGGRFLRHFFHTDAGPAADGQIGGPSR